MTAAGPPDDPEAARRVLRLAVELGVTFFDTAGNAAAEIRPVPIRSCAAVKPLLVRNN